MLINQLITGGHQLVYVYIYIYTYLMDHYGILWVGYDVYLYFCC